MRDLRIFSREFIGKDKVGRNCFVQNPDVISFKDSSDFLLAFSEEPIQVMNYITGYKINFYLKQFQYNKKTTIPKYSGYSFIQEIDTSDFSLEKNGLNRDQLVIEVHYHIF